MAFFLAKYTSMFRKSQQGKGRRQKLKKGERRRQTGEGRKTLYYKLIS
jgi:hypothetical protein